MTESKPRESVKVLFVTKNPIRTALFLDPHWCALDKPYNDFIPFIEKSAYDQLQSELKAKDELLRECEDLLSVAHKNLYFEGSEIYEKRIGAMLQKLREEKK